jgi:cyanophycinase-like exopeptidase
MIQGSWLDTGAGFGLLTHAAVFPHFDARGPEAAVKASAAHPAQLVVGLDNQAALIVKGDRVEAVGPGTVSLHNASGRP